MPIPNGFHSANVYLIVNDARKEIEFLKQAFAAQEGHASTMPGGSIIHAEVRLGDSTLMLGQANQAYKSQRSTVYVYLDDCDAAYRKAVEAGAKSLQEPKDQFYGDRSAASKIQTAFGGGSPPTLRTSRTKSRTGASPPWAISTDSTRPDYERIRLRKKPTASNPAPTRSGVAGSGTPPRGPVPPPPELPMFISNCVNDDSASILPTK